MKLESALRFDHAHLLKCTFQPNDDKGKHILEVSTPLTLANAKALDAQYLFVSDSVPRESARLMGAKLENVDIEIGMGADDARIFSPEVITSIKSAAVEDLGIELQFNAHFSGNEGIAVHALACQLNKSEVNFTIRPCIRTQAGPLFDANSEHQDAPDYQPTAEDLAAQEQPTNLAWTGKKARAVIRCEECEGGWRAGYEAAFSHRHAIARSAAADEMMPQPSEAQAIGAAAIKLVEFAREVEAQDGSRNQKDDAKELIDWGMKFFTPEQRRLAPVPVPIAAD